MGGRPVVSAPALRSTQAMDGGEEDRSRERRERRSIRRALWVVAGVGIVGFLTLARPVLLPLLFALVISMALHPLVRRMVRVGLPQPLAAAIVVLAIAAGGGASVNAAIEPLGQWATKVPQVVQRVRTEIGRMQRVVTQASARTVPMQQVRVRESDKPRFEIATMMSFAGELAAPMRAALIGTGITLVLAYFMLATGSAVLSTATALLRGHSLRTNVRRLGRATQHALVRYLGAVTLINLALGGAVAALLAALGMPGALFLGAVVAVLNFLPFVGALISAVVLGGAALATFGFAAQALVIPAAFLLLHLLEAQFVTPFVIGRTLTLNPLFVMISVVVFGTWWGVAGAFLAVPLLVTAKVCFDAVPQLRGWGQILGRRRSFSGGVEWLDDRHPRRERRRARPAARSAA